MGGYNVFIEGAAEPSAEGITRAATAIGARFGMPAEAIAQRMKQGRFRAKSNLELAAATKFAKQLGQLGAVCSVEDAAGNKVEAKAATSALLPPAPAKSSRPSSSLDVATPVPKPAGTKTPPGGYQSGLAAAFGGEQVSRPDTDLGVLTAESSALSLSSLDGETEADTATPAAESLAPPDPSERENLFRPPEESEAADNLELVIAPPTRATPPPMQAVTFDEAPAEPAVGAGPVSGTQPVVSVPDENALVRAKRALATKPRMRLAAGVLLAILLGFIPTTLFASWREGSAYADSRKEIHNMYADVLESRSADDWRALDERVKGVREGMSSSRQTLAITSMLIWGAAGGGVAFWWFRKLPWDSWATN